MCCRKETRRRAKLLGLIATALSRATIGLWGAQTKRCSPRKNGSLNFQSRLLTGIANIDSGTARDVIIVEGDVNGDGAADFQIQLKGLINLTKGDFVFKLRRRYCRG